MTVWGVTAKNAEQKAAIEILLDNNLPLKIITGKEGTGKNFITAASILELLLERQTYKKLILTRTTDEVGSTLGLMPGTMDEKFGVHLQSFNYTFKALVEGGLEVLSTPENKLFEYLPIQFMRGVSFPPGTIVWADEIAGLSPFELRMLGTRLGENCILILTGSLEQIDRRTRPEDTGLYKLIHSQKIQDSGLVGHVELIENQRSALSNLISEVL